MQDKTGGTAFPHITFDQGCDGHGLHFTNPDNPGMTLRQYYKAKAAAGWLANSDCIASASSAEEFAREMGKIADALLAEDVEFEAKQQGGGE